MEEVVTVGLDIAKSVFQAHGGDAAGQVDSRWTSMARCGQLASRSGGA
jgi:hypothetical protein